MREIGGMDSLYKRASDNEAIPPKDMDTAVEWLCLLFKNQFTPDEVYDEYPVDRFWIDIFTIYLAVKNCVADRLSEFPTQPETEETAKS
jgi:hypothetical protein